MTDQNLLVLDEVQTWTLAADLPPYSDEAVLAERRRTDVAICYNEGSGVDLTDWYERLEVLEEELDKRKVTWDPFEGSRVAIEAWRNEGGA